MHGFQDSVASRAHFLGSTVHFVDEGVDSGPPILQGVIPYDPHRDVKAHRHLVFLQQCKSLLQVVAWIAAGRLARNEDGRVLVRDARYAFSEFVPNLDSSDAIHFSIPEPKRFV
jgi:phosphoribosylglycinamide formyltransferase-1